MVVVEVGGCCRWWLMVGGWWEGIRIKFLKIKEEESALLKGVYVQRTGRARCGVREKERKKQKNRAKKEEERQAERER